MMIPMLGWRSGAYLDGLTIVCISIGRRLHETAGKDALNAGYSILQLDIGYGT